MTSDNGKPEIRHSVEIVCDGYSYRVEPSRDFPESAVSLIYAESGVESKELVVLDLAVIQVLIEALDFVTQSLSEA